jgi:signal transduction histidine kinase
MGLTVGLAVLSATWLTALQYRSLDTIVKNEEEHRSRELKNALSRMAKAFDFEVNRAHMTFQLGSAMPGRAQDVFDAWNRLAPYHNVVQGVYGIDGMNGGHLYVTPIGRSPNRDWSRIDWAELQRRRGDVSPELLQDPLGFLIGAPPPLPQADPVSLTSRLPALASGFLPAAPSRGLFVLLDRDYLLRDLLPLLLRRELGYNESDYDVAVFRTSDGKRLSGVAVSGALRATVPTVALFRVGLVCPGLLFPGQGGGGFGAMEYPSESDFRASIRAMLTVQKSDCPAADMPGDARLASWRLAATPRAGALLALHSFERRSLLVTSAAALSLAGSLAMLIVLIRRTHHLARLETEFVANVSHELRTPIGTIGVAADNLCSGMVRHPEDAIQYGHVIQAESRRLSQLIEQVLSYARALSRRWQPSCSPLSVKEIVDLALSNSGHALEAAGLSVQQRVAPDLPLINGDLHALARCIQNLLDNAVKYAATGGVVIVRAECAAGRKGSEMRLSVEDRGPGLGESEWKSVFDPFIRGGMAKANGVHGFGLGLNIAKRIVEAHHGIIETFRPAGGYGAGFLIRLPSLPDSSHEHIHEEPSPAG